MHVKVFHKCIYEKQNWTLKKKEQSGEITADKLSCSRVKGSWSYEGNDGRENRWRNTYSIKLKKGKDKKYRLFCICFVVSCVFGNLGQKKARRRQSRFAKKNTSRLSIMRPPPILFRLLICLYLLFTLLIMFCVCN